mmetsp:Transcript_10306/g.28438  ORF Transcript_10306/g.28438 Transcript_10306/m.28438 type:complete len:2169 (+) Transcript_10306:173-6679(+)|eukprot:CAMPEP_0168738840 /NCGR_PEP_ID=MMETSP0724-20121128/11145_1 /TAXON_ID=265536 /ORGANISM="Amphiprora sp., Strain CCMP467" /LENGTH=2168 /DNA_ID=CAMNT_0008786205 /DNA_START=111 /DNA_END=6617 /DNA_ORIENTATION=-
MSTNPAALKGWVKSKDPKTGRIFYANHITRKTQWDAPDDWEEDDVQKEEKTNDFEQDLANDDDDDSPLPGNWEVMHDPTTGKPFYVDHERKITTWTRPKAETQQHAEVSLRPAVATPPTSGNFNSAGLSRTRVATSTYQDTAAASASAASSSSWGRSYQQEMAYYSQPNTSTDVDFSDALPTLEFSVKKVSDSLRPECPSCNKPFTMTLRRHHCRLCGDVFCDACSNHRVELPLEGKEFEKPVRVCNACNVDVEAGNFFSMRRYMTPLQLYDGVEPSRGSDGQPEQTVATADNVNAALSAFTQDLEQMIQNGSVTETKSITPEQLIPVILKHLGNPDTADRTVRCMAALLAVETLTGATDYALHMYEDRSALDGLLSVLERSGSDRKTLYVQEQAARTVFYLTERKTVTSVIQKAPATSMDSAATAVDGLDLLRAIQSMLDHASNGGKNPNLSRWSAACIKNLIAEDERRACLAVNDVAAMVAVGEAAPPLSYESFVPQLIESGGIMILCSLISADDADTRAHAVGALGTTLNSTRAVDASMSTLAELTGGAAGRVEPKDGEIVRAIVAGGGCSSSVAQLLLSADNAVAGMGCQFLSCLAMPLLTDPAASAVPAFYDYRNDNTGIGGCREAAIEISTSACLPAILSLVRPGTGDRPTELRKLATETLAAVVYAVGEMGKAWSHGQYEEGLEKNKDAPSKFKEAIMLLNEEGVIDTCLAVLQSGTGQSLGSSGTETPASRIRESAGLVLGSLTSCSAEAIMNLQTRPQIMAALLTATNDISSATASTLRVDGAPRCLGVLETVSSLLMFAWQHPSGAGSELLDRLIEVLDAGVVPYLSRVVSTKIEWDSSTKAVGGMKAKAAAMRILSCIFGIALTDKTLIGMRRLMDAVDADAQGYRRGEKLPKNLMEAGLSCLQTSSNKARSSLISGGHDEAHYQTAVTELVDASLLAAGSLCGSSVAPGGSEGEMFSDTDATKSVDPYLDRRQHLCSLACDVVVRQTRNGPAVLPTMLVGGLGESASVSAVRLALAVAQSGTKEQHLKLASSGILVPISDSLRTALSSGDLYKFSASLALVRYCGPHVAAGQGGGLESVRNAIRVATNVLTLPINPHATIEQIETQESLKAECIRALEALSRNASLWSSISSDALPSIVRFLQMSVGSTGGSIDERRQQTRCAALRSVLQIVQVPSHAVSAAEDGLAEALGNLLLDGAVTNGDEVPMLALEVLHVIAMNAEARRRAHFLDTNMTRSICAALGKSATLKPNKPSDSRADVTFLGLEILSSLMLDITHESSIGDVLQSAQAIAFLDAVASEPQFVRSLCATLLLKTNMKISRHDAETSHASPELDIPALYGPPLILVQETCGGYDDTHHAAASILYTASVYACGIESGRSDAFWKTVFAQDFPPSTDQEDCLRLSATMAAHFLALMTVDYKPFVPSDPFRKEEYLTITRPLVRHRLLEWLKDSIDELGNDGFDPYIISVLVSFNVPHICLSLWKDPALLDLAFDLIQFIVEKEADEVLHLFVEGEAAIMSLFDLLNLDSSSIETSKNLADIRRFLGSTLGQLAEGGLLTQAVNRFGVRSSAISALAAACLAEEERPDDDDEEMDSTSSRLSTVLMKCLVELCTVTDASGRKSIRLTAAEAESIAKNLGNKICQMVLSRFLERAKLKQYEIDDDEDIMDAPDLGMLCAIAQHEAALKVIRSLGGLHALSLVAAEGNLLAMAALKKACETDASVLLEGDAHEVILKIFGAEDEELPWRSDPELSQQLEGVSFELLAGLCTKTAKGRDAVAKSEHCEGCVERAMKLITSLSGFEEEIEDAESGDDDDELFAESDEDETPAPTVPTAPPAMAPAPSAPGAFPPPPPSYDVLVTSTAPTAPELEIAPIGESELGVSACLLLSALAPVQTARKSLVESDIFVKALSSLAGDTAVAELRYAGLKLVSALLPYVAGEDKDSTDRLSEVLLSALTSEHKLKATKKLNANLLHCTSVAGIVVVYDYLSEEQQEVAGEAIAAHFMKTVKICTTARSTAKQAHKHHAAELSYNLTVALLLVRGKAFMDTVFTQDVLSSFFNLIQWRIDPKTSVEKGDEQSWDAAISNCLLILSLLLWRPDDILRKADVNLKTLAATSLMVARPGKAPRKAIDLKAALTRISDGNDASAALSAKRILGRIF